MKPGRALTGGVLGAVVAVLIFVAARVLLDATDPSDLIGELVLPDRGWLAWSVGAAAQIVLGAAASLVYAAVFEWVFRRAGAIAGVAVALPHAIGAGLAIGWLPLWAGMPTEALPGAFLAFDGLAAAACFVAAHLLFGAVVGATYGATRHTPAAPAVRWRELGRDEAETTP